jgi:hypothetical protein
MSHEVLPSRLGKEALPGLLSQIDIRNGLVVLAKALWILEDKGPLSAPVQLALATRLLGPAALGRARLLLQVEPHRVLFFRPQVHLAIKYLCRYGQLNEPSKPVASGQVQTIGTALLAATDLIAQESIRLGESLPPEDRLTTIALQLALGEHLMKSPNPLHDFVRAKSMYVGHHNAFALSPPPDFMDLDAVFSAAVGVPISEYLDICLGFLFNLIRYRGSADLMPDRKDFILLHPKKWFSSSNVKPEHVVAIVESISTTPQRIASTLGQQTSREQAHDFLSFKLAPLIGLGDDTYVPVSYDFIIERLSSGTYWVLFDYLRTQAQPNSHLRWSRYHGLLFERHAQEVANAIVEQHAGEYGPLVADAAYGPPKSQRRTSDAILVSPDHMIIVEVTASRLTARRTVALGMPEAFFDDCEKVVLKKADELASFIRDLVSGKVVLDGTPLLRDNRTIYPVLVALEGFPKIYPIDNYIYSELSTRRTFEGLSVAPLSILAVEDFEYIARYPPASVAGLMSAWHADSRFPFISLSEFMSESYPQQAWDPSPWFQDAFHRTIDEAARTIFGVTFEDIVAQAGSLPAGDLGA